MTMTVHTDSYGCSDRGRVYATNADQFLIATLSKNLDIQLARTTLASLQYRSETTQGELFVVADGIVRANHDDGEVASAEAIRGLVDYLLRGMHWHLHEREQHERELLREFSQALEHCQRRIAQHVPEDLADSGIASTLTAAYVAWPRAFVLQTGSSRCYRYRTPELKCITNGHNVAREVLTTDEGASAKSLSDSWTRYVLEGEVCSTAVVPELFVANLEPGDSLLLCTDGLTKHVSDGEISHVLETVDSAEGACENLVRQANAAGGTDNSTVVIAKFRPAEQLNAIGAAAAQFDSRSLGQTLLDLDAKNSADMVEAVA